MKSTTTGYLLALLAFSVFSIQDGLSKHLGDSYSPVVVATVRYWAFGLFAVALAARAPGGVARAARSARPVLQLLRGLLLGAQIIVSILAFRYVGLAHSQAVFAAGPIFVALLSVPLLGERVGWRRWLAIAIGLAGVIIILSPSSQGFSPLVVLPLVCAVMGAFYAILTRLVSRVDPPVTSFFSICMVGLVASSLVAPFYFTGVAARDWLWLGALCCTGIIGHLSLIAAYDRLNAVLVQPIAYLQLVFGSGIAVIFFNERLTLNMVAGSTLVVAAGLFTVWREQVVRRRTRLPADPPGAAAG